MHASIARFRPTNGLNEGHHCCTRPTPPNYSRRAPLARVIPPFFLSSKAPQWPQWSVLGRVDTCWSSATWWWPPKAACRLPRRVAPANACARPGTARWESMIDRPPRPGRRSSRDLAPAAVLGAEARPATSRGGPRARGDFPAVSVGNRCLSPCDHCDFPSAYVLPARWPGAGRGRTIWSTGVDDWVSDHDPEIHDDFSTAGRIPDGFRGTAARRTPVSVD